MTTAEAKRVRCRRKQRTAARRQRFVLAAAAITVVSAMLIFQLGYLCCQIEHLEPNADMSEVSNVHK